MGFFTLLTSYTQLVYSFNPTFDQNTNLKDYDFYNYSQTTDINSTGSYTGTLNSKEKIESFLCSRQSVLCNRSVTTSLYSSGGVYYLNKTGLAFTPGSGYVAIEGQNMLVSEVIWRLARTNLVQGCVDYSDLNTCFDNSQVPINPGFLLAFIQKESRLVNGACAKADADTNPACSYSNPNDVNKLAFRIDRATGYFCFETSVKSDGCWDENPNWEIYKGFFRQLYHAMRRIKMLQTMCRLGGGYSFKNSNGDFKVGSTVSLDGIPVILKNDITCALYIYTPHVSSLLWSTMYGYAVLSSLYERFGVPEDYVPTDMVRF